MKPIPITVIIASALLLSSCATYRPIVDLKGEDRNIYEWNLKDCQRYAEELNPGVSAVAGAGIGAGLGAITGLIVGATLGVDAGQLAGFGAAIGGLYGATSGGATSAISQQQIIKNCLAGRGYRVLR